MGRFITRDTFQGFSQHPASLNRFAYVEGNPINRVDPTGHWWWGPGQALYDASTMRAQGQNVHVRIQAIAMLGRMDQVHAEYVIPGTLLPVDLLNSVSGEMWEIKPWDERDTAWTDLEPRLLAMDAARHAELLQGMTPVATEYNWNFAPVEWIPGIIGGFPAEVYIGRDDSGYFDIYAGQVEAGVIAWWKVRRQRPEQVPYPVYLPDPVAWSNRNVRQGWVPTTVPVFGSDPFGIPGPALPQNQPGAICPTLPDPTNGGTIVIIVGGTTLTVGAAWGVAWLAGKLLSPLCGPAAPLCAIAW